MNHNILLDRLRDIGLSENYLAWFKSYCSGWLQSVRVEGLPTHLPLSNDVPQGSILGPTLFTYIYNIYINNINLAAGNSHIHLYADDTIIYTTSPSLTTAFSTLQDSFNNIQPAFSSLRFSLNTNKTKLMLFNRSCPRAECHIKIFVLDGSEIDIVETYKYLGIWLDSKLSFETHINTLLSKVKSRINFLHTLC